MESICGTYERKCSACLQSTQIAPLEEGFPPAFWSTLWVNWSTPGFLCYQTLEWLTEREANVVCTVDCSASGRGRTCHGQAKGEGLCIFRIGNPSSSWVKTAPRVWCLAPRPKSKLHSTGPFPNTIPQLQLIQWSTMNDTTNEDC